jgi:hypothetical protein
MFAPMLVGVAAVPLNVTVLVPWVAPKVAPLIVTEVPTGPEVAERLLMLGATPAAGVEARIRRTAIPQVSRAMVRTSKAITCTPRRLNVGKSVYPFP